MSRSNGWAMPDLILPARSQTEIRGLLDDALEQHRNGNYWQAEKRYRRILRASPDHPQALALLAMIEHHREQYELALKLMDRSIEGDATAAQNHYNRASILFSLGRFSDAIEAYMAAIGAHRGYSMAYMGLGAMLLELCRPDEALYAFRQAVQHAGAEDDAVAGFAAYIFAVDVAPSATVADAMEARRLFDETFCAKFESQWPVHQNDPDPDRRIRIGYVGGDFFRHSAADCFGMVLAHHDASQFDVTIYSHTVSDDEWTAMFRQGASRWRDIQTWSDERLALQVLADKIDVLIDLAAYSRNGRLMAFARKPAPVQITGWGYATGTGMRSMDYLISDAMTIPREDQWQHVETVLHAPATFSFLRSQSASNRALDLGQVGMATPADFASAGHPDVIEASRLGLGQPPTFGLYNRQAKLNPEVFDAAAEILRRVPEGRLAIKNAKLSSPSLQAHMRQQFEQRGIDGERIHCLGSTSRVEHLRWHRGVDVMLDPWPQNGGMSGFESLWMGVPLVTLEGDRMPGRLGAMLNMQADCEDWIVNDRQQYVERAVAAVRDVRRLIHLRENLRGRLLETEMCRPSYAKAVEDLYREAWRRWCAERNQPAVGDGDVRQ